MLSTMPGQTLTVLLITCEDLPKWDGYSLKLWQDTLDSPGAIWHEFHAPSRQLPTLNQVKLAQVMILTGSHYSAYEDLPWIHALTKALPEYVQTGIRTIACCFGHQLISKSLGGVIGKNPSNRFVLGIEDIYCDKRMLAQLGLLIPLEGQQLDTPEAATPPVQQSDTATGATTPPVQQESPRKLLPGAEQNNVTAFAATAAERPAIEHAMAEAPDASRRDVASSNGVSAVVTDVCRFSQVESHGDCVLELPQGAVKLAWSGTADNEMWALGYNVLSFQFHPEMPPEVALDKIYSALKATGRLSDEELNEAHHTLSTRSPHTTEFKSLLKHFIAYGLHADNLPSPAEGQALSQSQSQLQRRHDTAQGSESPAIIPATTSAGQLSSSPGSSQRLPTSAQQASDRAATEPQQELLDVQESQGAQGCHKSSNTLTGITSTAQEVQVGQRVRAEMALTELIASARVAFDAGLQHTLVDCDQLTAMNQVAAGACSAAADRAQQLSETAHPMQAQISSISRALESLPHLEVLLDSVSKVVDLVDTQSKALAKGLGVPEGGGVFAWT